MERMSQDGSVTIIELHCSDGSLSQLRGKIKEIGGINMRLGKIVIIFK